MDGEKKHWNNWGKFPTFKTKCLLYVKRIKRKWHKEIQRKKTHKQFLMRRMVTADDGFKVENFSCQGKVENERENWKLWR